MLGEVQRRVLLHNQVESTVTEGDFLISEPRVYACESQGHSPVSNQGTRRTSRDKLQRTCSINTIDNKSQVIEEEKLSL